MTETTIREMYAAFAAHDLPGILRRFTTDCELEDVAAGSSIVGRHDLQLFLQDLYEGLGHLTVVDLSIVASGTQAACRFTITGDHSGTLFGYPATGRSIKWRLCSFFDLSETGNAIVREEYFYDRARLEEQLQ